jgi:formylglycine-generating enzyme required for sulfatase activity
LADHENVASGSPSPGEGFREASFAPEMVVIPAGGFLMGSTYEGGSYCELPRHRVVVPKPFGVGRRPVTFDEWDACFAAKGTSHNPYDFGWGRGRRPVIDVSWEDAKIYAAWLSAMTGQPYRLLSEAEWEYCCRAGEAPGAALNEVSESPAKQARLSEDDYGNAGGTAETGSFPPNVFGLYDLHGNVMEWVEDCWNDGYEEKPVALCDDGGAWMSGDCTHRVVRGLSWFHCPRHLCPAWRGTYPAATRGAYIGFRIARTLFDVAPHGGGPYFACPTISQGKKTAVFLPPARVSQSWVRRDDCGSVSPSMGSFSNNVGSAPATVSPNSSRKRT